MKQKWLLHFLFKGLNGTCDETTTGLHPHQPPTQIATVSRELPQRHTAGDTVHTLSDMVTQEQWLWWGGRANYRDRNQTVLILSLPWQFAAVQYSAWWTLPCSVRRRQERNLATQSWLENRKQEGKCVKVSLTQVVSFKFSTFCKKENKTDS